MNPSSSPSLEIGKTCTTGHFETNYHDVGDGAPILMIHGSGPGVSAWANWRGVLADMGKTNRVIAPDMVGFGYTQVPAGEAPGIETWLAQLVALLDKLELPKVHVVGNSFGGAIALHFTRTYPERVSKLALMGAVSSPFPITDGLEKVWGYTPSVDNMRQLMDVFVHNKALISEDLIKLRYEASKQRGMDKVYESLFPAPRQKWVELLGQSDDALRSIQQPTLILHGRDDRVIPFSASLRAFGLIPNADLLAFGNCGHWTQIEKRDEFVNAVLAFFNKA